MRMNDEQAAEFCRQKAMNALSRGTYSGEGDSHWWSRQRSAIERDGLDSVVGEIQGWLEEVRRDTDPRHSADTGPEEALLAAIEDGDLIRQLLAGTLKERFEKELAKLDPREQPYRFIALVALVDALEKVEDDEPGTELDTVTYDAHDTVTEETQKVLDEYEKIIDDAIAAQGEN